MAIAGASAPRCRHAARIARSWPPTPIPLTAALPACPAAAARSCCALFEPLGYAVDAARSPLDARPRTGAWRRTSRSRCGEVPLAELLAHLYVLIPVLDDEKHY